MWEQESQSGTRMGTKWKQESKSGARIGTKWEQEPRGGKHGNKVGTSLDKNGNKVGTRTQKWDENEKVGQE